MLLLTEFLAYAEEIIFIYTAQGQGTCLIYLKINN